MNNRALQNAGLAALALMFATGVGAAPINQVSYASLTGTKLITFDAVCEGSFAVLFSTDQCEFGFQLVGGNGGSATIDFFARDGSLIAEILVAGLADAFYGFSRDGGIKDIAGISITNNDPAGIGLDNLKHDVQTTIGAPEPGTRALLGLAILCMVYVRRGNLGCK